MKIKDLFSQTSFITISIDDGAPEDLKVANLLHKFGLKATFYIPAYNRENKLLQKRDIKLIAKDFEVGGHTYHHVPLAKLKRQQAEEEVLSGKKWLEDVVGKRVNSFCYPRGKFTRETTEIVAKAGFLGARTCFFNHVSWPKNPFLWGVSTHAFSHPFSIQVRHAILERNFQGLSNYLTKFKMSQDWEFHFSCALDYVENNAGVAHLYFHSWEINKYSQWDKLERVLRNIHNRTSLVSVTNEELFQLWHQRRSIPKTREN
ncbi:MAG: polysaccharide deacetylase family protein [Candidatus Omnitrophica bacterium]|nr:polysaccharide deacetylase family protein [Candidatus Omnitrophota bacterium]